MNGNDADHFFGFTFVDDFPRVVKKSRSFCKKINDDIRIK